MKCQNKQKIIAQLDEKLAPFTREIQELKLENESLREKVYHLEKPQRNNNLILYGIKESEKSSHTLMETIKNKFRDDLNVFVEDRDINMIYRIGKTDLKKEKIRPILISFVNNWKRSDIMKNKNKLKNNVYASEDYPKEILDKRRELLPKLIEEKKKGKYAVLNYDKLIIKEGSSSVKEKTPPHQVDRNNLANNIN